MEKYEYPEKSLNPKWINGSIPIDDMAVQWANTFGAELSRKKVEVVEFGGRRRDKHIKPLTTSQIRRFFGEVKRIQSDFEKYGEEVPLIKAKLAYAVGRDYDKDLKRASSKIQEFYDELAIGLAEIKGEASRFRNFVKLLEAVVAFHKFYGGKDN